MSGAGAANAWPTARRLPQSGPCCRAVRSGVVPRRRRGDVGAGSGSAHGPWRSPEARRHVAAARRPLGRATSGLPPSRDQAPRAASSFASHRAASSDPETPRRGLPARAVLRAGRIRQDPRHTGVARRRHAGRGGGCGLDAEDNDPVALLEYLARALLDLTPLDPAVLGWLELPDPPVRRVVVPAIVSAAGGAPAFVLVLDDAHLLRDERCWRILAAVAEGMSAGSSVVIGSRSDPPLPLGKLRTQGLLAEYRLARPGVRPRRDAGGPRAARRERRRPLAGPRVRGQRGMAGRRVPRRALGPRRQVPRPSIAEGRRTGRRRLPDGRGAERAAGGRDRPSDAHRGGRPDLPRALRRAHRAQPTARTSSSGSSTRTCSCCRWTSDRVWYRCHHLLRELLLSELERRGPDLVPELHHRAAIWFRDAGQPGECLHHLLAAGEIEEAAGVVAAEWWPHYLGGRVWTARQWLDLFTVEQVREHLGLRLAGAWVYAFTGEPDMARGLVGGLDPSSLDGLATGDETRSPRSSLLMIRALLAADGPCRMREDAREAVRLEDAAQVRGRACATSCSASRSRSAATTTPPHLALSASRPERQGPAQRHRSRRARRTLSHRRRPG